MSGSGTGLEVRRCGNADLPVLLALHERAYGERRSEAHWRWRYLGTGAPCSITGAFAADGRCLAVHAGLPVRLWHCGAEFGARMCGDIAVDPDLRHGLRGGRVAIAVTRAFLAAFGRDPVALMWGYPQPSMRRLLTGPLGLLVVDDVSLLVREVMPPLAPPPAGEVVVTRQDRAPADADALWTRLRGELRTAVVRDRAHLAWRYDAHPDVTYRYSSARGRDGALLGIAIVRDGGLHPSAATLVELLVPDREHAAERALLAAALEDARALGRVALVTWAPAPWRIARRLQAEYGFYMHPTSYQHVAAPFRRDLDRDSLHESWYRSFGDMDFV